MSHAIDELSMAMNDIDAQLANASGVASGAITTSRNSFTSSAATLASSVRFTATMPPKIDTGSQA